MHISSQKGVAAVELTILLPFFLLVIFATAELGRALYQYNTLTKLVRDAGRYLANNADKRVTTTLPSPLSDANCGNCITQTKNLLVYGNITGSGTPLLYGLSIANVNIANAPSGSRQVMVSANYDWQPLFSETLPVFGFGESIDLSFNLNASYAVTAL